MLNDFQEKSARNDEVDPLLFPLPQGYRYWSPVENKVDLGDSFIYRFEGGFISGIPFLWEEVVVDNGVPAIKRTRRVFNDSRLSNALTYNIPKQGADPYFDRFIELKAHQVLGEGISDLSLADLKSTNGLSRYHKGGGWDLLQTYWLRDMSCIESILSLMIILERHSTIKSQILISNFGPTKHYVLRVLDINKYPDCEIIDLTEIKKGQYIWGNSTEHSKRLAAIAKSERQLLHLATHYGSKEYNELIMNHSVEVEF